MNTSQTIDNKPQANAEMKPKEKKKQSFDFFFVGGNSDPVSNVVDTLSSVDLNSPDADMNAHSISDNDGGRIELNQDGSEVIKK